MRCCFGRTTACSDQAWDSYIHINNFGFYEDITHEISVCRPAGRLDYQLILITGGEGRFRFDGAEHTVCAGGAVLYRPGELQHYKMPVGNSNFWIHFSGNEIAPLLERMGLTQTLLCAVQSDRIKKIFERMMELTAAGDPAEDDLLNALFISLLGEIRPQSPGTDTGIARVISKMRAEGFGGLSIKEYAALSGFSEYHFIRKFKAATRLTPHQYKLHLLMEKAIDLLKHTTLNISEIATMLEFDDTLYFSRLFKKHMGASPKHFRK